MRRAEKTGSFGYPWGGPTGPSDAWPRGPCGLPVTTNAQQRTLLFMHTILPGPSRRSAAIRTRSSGAAESWTVRRYLRRARPTQEKNLRNDPNTSSIFSILRAETRIATSEECTVNSFVTLTIDDLGSPSSAKSPRQRCTALGSPAMREVMSASTRSSPASLKESGERICAGRLLDEVRSVKGKESEQCCLAYRLS